ncbi:Phosphoglucomutase (alpha-D-glucose-1,6-bisphosphate-dependent) [Saliniradius amylolyticus]|uniref:Phosphoglucomutase n=1 Tax=Saliniradius amylolyticus TaxID=2183582 RepID=A0A2S2E566_9ALTE|nr:phosphoglucomutase (alpha-D-glucose-1,6-bisphosphate-dependent) [Saliniradius amylolyticus]AWL12127.1 Phosphoglucomutase (alpha-D-glucose-1,6-bisphosphate-dependent) [Saliniradius amylolyticus]
MALHPQAGKTPTDDQLTNIPRLVAEYYSKTPDTDNPEQLVSFGTSGHRGSSVLASFTDAHIAAICQALAEYRQQHGIEGPLFVGMDTHALSEAAFITAIEVLSANGVALVIEKDRGYTPTPVISHAILTHNREQALKADGIVITPSHNPPQDGGFKYNPPHGGPADKQVTDQIQNRANELLRAELKGVQRQPFATAMDSGRVSEKDFAEDYVADLANVVDMQVIAKSGLKLAVDPLGGAGLAYWKRIAEHYQLDLTIVNQSVDPSFRFMTCDKDGKIRMDCSSPYAMAGLIELRKDFDLAFGNDPDADRHGIVSRESGLLNPNHYLAVVIDYLYQHRPEWRSDLAIGKTLVSSSMIDRVAEKLQRPLQEMPVGFKWFVQHMQSGAMGFAGEESAGGIFLRRNGEAWATDKDGIILCLLAAEMLAVTGKDPGQHYQRLTKEHGEPAYQRIDVAASGAQKQCLAAMTAEVVTSKELAGEPITRVLTKAPGNDAALGGVKVCTENGWFAARPSGTEAVYKIYAESFKGQTHLEQLLTEAQQLVANVFAEANV